MSRDRKILIIFHSEIYVKFQYFPTSDMLYHFLREKC